MRGETRGEARGETQSGLPAPSERRGDGASRRRLLAAISGGGSLIFVITLVVAASLYPGGTWADRSTVGHSFFGNYLCDLMQHRALNGEPAELGSLLARIGSVAMFAALASFFLQVARLEETRSLRGRITVRAGLFAALVSCSVPLLTSDRFRTAHVIAVVASFLPAFVATVAGFGICLRSPRSTRLIKGAALVAVIAGGIDGFLYAFAYGAFAIDLRPPGDVRRLINDLLPLLQRIATLGLLAWVLAMTLRTARR